MMIDDEATTLCVTAVAGELSFSFKMTKMFYQIAPLNAQDRVFVCNTVCVIRIIVYFRH